MKIKHIVTMKFSVRTHWNTPFKTEEERNEWFAFRAKLFRASILKSIQSQQKIKFDQIFLHMDINDTGLFEQHLGGIPEITPVFDAPETRHDWQTRYLADDFGTPVCISRIDSDDLISTDYAEKTQTLIDNAVASEDCDLMNIVAADGIITDLKYIQSVTYPSSPFCSIFQRSFDGTQHFGEHHKFKASHILSSDQPMWAQIVHDTNVANSFWSTRISRVSSKNWPKSFVPINQLADLKAILAPIIADRKTTRKLYLALLSLPYGTKIITALKRVR